MEEPLLLLQTDQPLPAAQVGGKAAVLSLLLREGFPVPPGICLTTAASAQILAPYHDRIQSLLSGYDLADPDRSAHVSGQIRGLLSGFKLPPALLASLEEHLPHIGRGRSRFAVRSSAVHEDGLQTSFAGQYATILGARGLDQIHAAVLACCRAYFSPQALAARAHSAKNTAQAAATSLDLAILIQPLIDAGCAGVAFSIDPVAQTGQHLIINSAWGLGAGLADCCVPTDTDWLLRRGLAIKKRHIPPKPWQIKLDKSGQMQVTAVPPEWQRAACLPQEWLQRVAQMAVALQNLFGRPQDVEWAIAGQKLWILQSRPVTALPPELRRTPPFPVTWQGQEKRFAWKPAYFHSNLHDPPLPLELDQYRVMEEERERTCAFMGIERHEIYKVINGRPYSRRQPLSLSAADLRLRSQALEAFRDRLFAEGRTMWDIWGPEVESQMARLRDFDLQGATAAGLADHLQACLAALRRATFIHPQCIWRPRQAYFEAYSAVSGQSGPQAQEAATQLLQGEETPLTTLIDALYDLALIARPNPTLTSLLSDPPADVHALLQTLPASGRITAFQQKLSHILHEYGERMGDGYGSRTTVCSPTWREQPAELLLRAAVFLDPAVQPPAAARAQTQADRDARAAALCAACDDQEAVAEFRRLLAHGPCWWTVLETHNHFIDQMDVGHLRHALIAAARLLVAGRALAREEDIYWLTFSEILHALQAAEEHSLHDKIEQRRRQHDTWAAMTPPPLLGLPAADLPPRPPAADEVTEMEDAPGLIRGIGAAPGQIRGRARVVHDAWRLPHLQPGDILVAPNIGPRWTPLLPILAGIVLDEGSVGQHAAATAREYGLAAVVGTKDATRRINDKSQIFVDGLGGIVRKLPTGS